MKASFTNELASSFLLFLDHEVCYEGEAFYNVVSGSLLQSEDSRFYSLPIYQSQYRQWVVDDSLSALGATIPNEVEVNGVPFPKGVNGLNIDYGMGRVFFEDTFPKNAEVKASFSAKEFNIYMTSKDESQLILSDQLGLSDYPSGLPPEAEPYPLIYVRNFYGENYPFAFGGLEESEYEFRCSALADSSFKLDSLNCIMQDSARKYFPVLKSSDIPFNVFGDLKSGVSSYNYETICSDPDFGLAYIEKVSVSKFDEKINKSIKDGIWGSFADFKVKALRFPRQK
jgi:hypothetical protein